MRNPIVAFLFLVVCSGVSLAQNSVREQSQPEQIPVAKQSDLMEHSGMQVPKAIPSVKLFALPGNTGWDSSGQCRP